MQESIKAAIDFRQHDIILRKFALKEFLKKYPNGSSASVWFNGYDVIDENTIRILYQYGGGDMEMDGSWKVKIE